MAKAVLDSSAVLALLFGEAGSRHVAEVLPGALLSSINFAEVILKLTERGMPGEEASQAVRAMGVEIVDFDHDHALAIATLKSASNGRRLSLADRACLALSNIHARPALTVDRSWLIDKQADVVVIR